MEHIGTVAPTPPFNFVLTLDMIGRYIHPILDHARDGAYWRALALRGGTALVCVRDSLDVYVAAPTGAPDPATLLNTLREMLDASLDLRPFYAFASQDEALWSIVEPLVGIRLVRAASVFEALMLTIIEQQIAWTAAQKAQRWLVEWAGNAVKYGGETYYAFPTPKQIAQARVEDFTPMKITFRRMGRMIDIARAAAEGALDLEGLTCLPIDEAYQRLVAIHGIGHWTACWTLTRAFGPAHNYIGHNDVALQAAVSRYFFSGNRRINANQVAETFARYGEYAGLAAHYTIMRWVMEKYDGAPSG